MMASYLKKKTKPNKQTNKNKPTNQETEVQWG